MRQCYFRNTKRLLSIPLTLYPAFSTITDFAPLLSHGQCWASFIDNSELNAVYVCNGTTDLKRNGNINVHDAEKRWTWWWWWAWCGGLGDGAVLYFLYGGGRGDVGVGDGSGNLGRCGFGRDGIVLDGRGGCDRYGCCREGVRFGIGLCPVVAESEKINMDA